MIRSSGTPGGGRVQAAGLALFGVLAAAYVAWDKAPLIFRPEGLRKGVFIIREAPVSTLITPRPKASLTLSRGPEGSAAYRVSAPPLTVTKPSVFQETTVVGEAGYGGLSEPEAEPDFLPARRPAAFVRGRAGQRGVRQGSLGSFPSGRAGGGTSAAFFGLTAESVIGRAGRRPAAGVQGAVKALARKAAPVVAAARKAAGEEGPVPAGPRAKVATGASGAVIPAAGPRVQAATAGPAGPGLSPPAPVDEIRAAAGGTKSEPSTAKDAEASAPRPARPAREGGPIFVGSGCGESDDVDSLFDSPEFAENESGARAGFAGSGEGLCRVTAYGERDASRIARAIAPAYAEAAEDLASVLEATKGSLGGRIRADEAEAAELYRWKRDVIGNVQLHGCVYGAANAITNRIVWLKGYDEALGEALAGLKTPRLSGLSAPLAWRAAALRAAEHEEAIAFGLGELIDEAKSFTTTCTTGIPDRVAGRRYQAGQEAKDALKALMDVFIPRQEELLAAFKPGLCRGGSCAAPDLSVARRLIALQIEGRDAYSDFIDDGVGRGIQEANSVLEEAGLLFEAPEARRGRAYIEGVYLLSEASRIAESEAADWQESRTRLCSGFSRCRRRRGPA